MLAHTMSLNTKEESRKREIIQSNVYRIYPKVIQVSLTLDTICVPNIMILAKEGLEILCSQGDFPVNGVTCSMYEQITSMSAILV